MTVLAWYNLVFYIPLAMGVLMIVGVLLGVTELPHGVDVDGEAHVDAEADHGGDHGGDGTSAGQTLLTILGFGKAPLLILIMSMTLVFGGTGVIANLFLAPLLAKTSGFVVVSLGIALVVMVTLTGLLARLVNRFMPGIETTSVTKNDLVGCQGSLVLASDQSEGLAQITKHGDVFQLRCRSSEPIEKGASILVTDYDPKHNLYFVCRNPLN